MTTEKIIIFIGPQGSGKGTQAQILVAKINAEYIEMGAQLRKIAAQDTEFGSLIRNILEEGKLVDNQNWGSIIRDQIAKIQANRPIILDGSPRNIEQAHILIDYLHSIGRNNIATIYISVPRQESLRRLMLRRVCSECKTSAILNGSQDQVCAKCGGNLVRRFDDNEQAINVRLSIYERDTFPVVDFLKTKTDLKEIDGSAEISDITKEIYNALGIA